MVEVQGLVTGLDSSPPHIYLSLAFGGLRSARDPSRSFLIFVGFLGILPSRCFLLFVLFSGLESVESPPTFVQPFLVFSRVFVRFGRGSLTTLEPPQSFILFIYFLFL